MAHRTGHEVVLVRHGETEWSLSGQHTGTTDVPLTEEGKQVAKRVGDKLKERSFAAVYASPLSRALDTARLAGYDEEVEIREELREWDYGAYEGLSTPQIREERAGWWLWRDGCPGGETAAQVGERADRVIADLREIDGDALVFAHGHILRILAARWIGLEPESGALFGLETATLSSLGWEREVPVIWKWNAP
ncbi:MAG: histidine phosphatase family protein [Solirubrobacteraceae bacterium]